MIRGDIRQYLIVTGNYWAFTLTDGALRMLVLLYFYGLGYSPLQVASLFLLYEFFGVVTNLVGGWLAAHLGLNRTMQGGLLLQIAALSLLLVEPAILTVAYVMVAQALSGIAKDLNKMSAKSSIKLLLPNHAQGKLYRWVAFLTGSKNALKGAGFLLGGLLLSLFEFQGAISLLAVALTTIFLLSLFFLSNDFGRFSQKPKFTDVFSKSAAVNRLSAARFFLFGARDVWFVVALPVFLQSQLGWSHVEVGTLMALWIIGYGVTQSLAPMITGRTVAGITGRNTAGWGMFLAVIPLVIIGLLLSGIDAIHCVVIGLLLFGAVFAINSAVHSFLIVSYARADGVSLDVGFYYTANAAGRLVGTLLSGAIYQWFGFEACLLVSAMMIAASSWLAVRLPSIEGVA